MVTGKSGEHPSEIEVRDLQELIRVLTQDEWQPSQPKYRVNTAYRGLSSETHALETGLSRLSGESPGNLEQHLLRNFRKYAHREVARGDSVWNWISLAQHHGLPTRLLDWTFSPYVALHFVTASVSSYSEPGIVWSVDYSAAHRLLPSQLQDHVAPFGCGLFTTEMLEAAAGSLERLDDLNQTNEPPMLLFFEPPSLDDRIINQSAVFSIMTAPDADLGEWFLQHPELCRKVVIPAHLKWPIRNHLDQANVTERVLFPGLDGLCRWLARYYGDRPEKMYPMPENGQADHDMET
jgi:hypothetical protein